MSQTTCPGDVVYDLIRNQFPVEVSAIRQQASAQPEPDVSGDTEAETPGPSEAETPGPSIDETPGPSIDDPPGPSIDDRPPIRSAPVEESNLGVPIPYIGGAAGGALSFVAGLLAIRTRRKRYDDDLRTEPTGDTKPDAEGD